MTQPPARPPFPVPHLMAIAMLEGVVLLIAALHLSGILAPADLNRPPHLAWFLLCVVMAGMAPMTFILRSKSLATRERAGETVDDERKQVLLMSLALLLPAGAIAAVGPRFLELLLGA